MSLFTDSPRTVVTGEAEQTDWQAQRLNQPLIAFQSSRHPGGLGKSFSILRVSDSRVRVLALKKAEDSDEVIVRIVELDGRPATNVRLSFAAPVVSAREVNGQEQPLGRATINNGQLVTSLGRYQPRTFAVKLAAPSIRMSSPRSEPIALDYDLDVATVDGEKSSAGLQWQRCSVARGDVAERDCFRRHHFSPWPEATSQTRL